MTCVPQPPVEFSFCPSTPLEMHKHGLGDLDTHRFWERQLRPVECAPKNGLLR
jgi:hypothetical protein